MIRPAIVLALLLSAALMMRGVASDWRKSPLPPAENAAKKAAPAGETAPMAQQSKGLQPVVPGVLPDLKSHYLFNPERMLAGGAETMPTAESDSGDEASGNTQGINASMGEVTYVGSIIADQFSRALILYPAAKSKAPAQPAPSKSSKSKPPPSTPSKSGDEEHAKLEVGDVLDGYTVAEILPNKIIFTKGEESVEKLLYDPGKKRQAPPPRPAAAPPGGGGQQRPQQIPVGGAAPTPTPPAPGTAVPAAPPAPGAVAPPAATPPVSSPTPPPVIKPPATPAAAGGAKTNPFRQMVISRQAAPAPDTSKVSRQSSEVDSTPPMPMPPGEGATNEQPPNSDVPPPGGN